MAVHHRDDEQRFFLLTPWFYSPIRYGTVYALSLLKQPNNPFDKGKSGSNTFLFIVLLSEIPFV